MTGPALISFEQPGNSRRDRDGCTISAVIPITRRPLGSIHLHVNGKVVSLSLQHCIGAATPAALHFGLQEYSANCAVQSRQYDGYALNISPVGSSSDTV